MEMLQWGRDRSIAELLSHRLRKLFEIVLQWGRDRSIAELRLQTGTFRALASLQWGRDRSIAELRNADWQAHRQDRFNGAAIDRSRNCGLGERTQNGSVLLQWGRDRSIAELG